MLYELLSPYAGDLNLFSFITFRVGLSLTTAFILTMMFGYSQPDMPGAVHDYGTKFLVTAGLLNILSIADVFEIATGKKD